MGKGNTMKFNLRISTLLALLLVAFVSGTAAAQDFLPSWNDGPAKKAILEFVAAVTDENGKDYVPPEDRIAAHVNVR
jgi:hypothetical protein